MAKIQLDRTCTIKDVTGKELVCAKDFVAATYNPITDEMHLAIEADTLQVGVVLKLLTKAFAELMQNETEANVAEIYKCLQEGQNG